ILKAKANSYCGRTDSARRVLEGPAAARNPVENREFELADNADGIDSRQARPQAGARCPESFSAAGLHSRAPGRSRSAPSYRDEADLAVIPPLDRSRRFVRRT